MILAKLFPVPAGPASGQEGLVNSIWESGIEAVWGRGRGRNLGVGLRGDRKFGF